MSTRTPIPQESQRPRLIVACTDFSELSLPALYVARSVAVTVGAALQVVSVFEDSGEVVPSNIEEFSRVHKEVETRLETLVADLAQPGLNVSALLLRGGAATAIQRLVAEEEPELLVLGTHGRQGLQRWLIGSTAEATLRGVSCPVLTVGPHSYPVETAAKGPVVLATDFGRGAKADAAYALGVALRSHAGLDCIHVLPAGQVAQDTIATRAMVGSLQELIQGGDQAAQVRCFLVPGTHVSHDIVDYARQNKASVIVLGVRQRSQLTSHLPMEGVAWILANATCPVYTLSHSSSEVDLTELSSPRHRRLDHMKAHFISERTPKSAAALAQETISQTSELHFIDGSQLQKGAALVAREEAQELLEERRVEAAALANRAYD